MDESLSATSKQRLALVFLLKRQEIHQSIALCERFTVDEKARNGGAAKWAFMRSFNAAARAQSKNALGQAFLLLGKQNVLRIDPPESDNAIKLDDVRRSLKELPLVARSLVEGSGHPVQEIFLQDAVDEFLRCPLA